MSRSPLKSRRKPGSRSRSAPEPQDPYEAFAALLDRIPSQYKDPDFRSAAECVNILSTPQPERLRDELLAQFKEVDQAMNMIVEENYEKVHQAFRTYGATLRLFNETKEEVDKLQGLTETGRQRLTRKNPNLATLSMQAIQHRETVRLLKQVDTAMKAPERIESHLKAGRYLRACRVLMRTLRRLEDPESTLSTIGALRDIAADLSERKNTIHEMLVDALQNLIYMKTRTAEAGSISDEALRRLVDAAGVPDLGPDGQLLAPPAGQLLAPPAAGAGQGTPSRPAGHARTSSLEMPNRLSPSRLTFSSPAKAPPPRKGKKGRGGRAGDSSALAMLSGGKDEEDEEEEEAEEEEDDASGDEDEGADNSDSTPEERAMVRIVEALEEVEAVVTAELAIQRGLQPKFGEILRVYSAAVLTRAAALERPPPAGAGEVPRAHARSRSVGALLAALQPVLASVLRNHAAVCGRFRRAHDEGDEPLYALEDVTRALDLELQALVREHLEPQAPQSIAARVAAPSSRRKKKKAAEAAGPAASPAPAPSPTPADGGGPPGPEAPANSSLAFSFAASLDLQAAAASLAQGEAGVSSAGYAPGGLALRPTPYHLVFLYSPLARLARLSGAPPGRSEVRAFLDEFAMERLLPRLASDYGSRASAALDGPDAFRPRDAAGLRPPHEARRPLLQGAAACAAVVGELATAARLVPPIAPDVAGVAEQMLARFLDACAARYARAVGSSFAAAAVSDAEVRELYRRDPEFRHARALAALQPAPALASASSASGRPPHVPAHASSSSSSSSTSARAAPAASAFGALFPPAAPPAPRGSSAGPPPPAPPAPEAVAAHRAAERDMELRLGFHSPNAPPLAKEDLILQQGSQQLVAVATIADSLDWLASRLRSVVAAASAASAAAAAAAAAARASAVFVPGRSSVDDEAAGAPEAAAALSGLLDAAARAERDAEASLFALRLELRCHALHFLEAAAHGPYGGEEGEGEGADPWVAALGRDLTALHEALAPCLAEPLLRHIFSGLAALVESTLISALQRIAPAPRPGGTPVPGETRGAGINAHGVLRMVRNVFALQHVLPAAVAEEEGPFQTVRQYYELLNLPPEGILGYAAEHPTEFTFGQYRALLVARAGAAAAGAAGPEGAGGEGSMPLAQALARLDALRGRLRP